MATINGLTCKYCQSENVIKNGKYKDTQNYLCKDCKKRFASTDTIPKMQNSTKTIADALNMYYEGMSLAEIRRNLIQQDNNNISRITAYNWVKRFTELAVKEAEKYTPKVGDVWIADETFMRVDKSNSTIKNPYWKERKEKWVIFWDIIDADTRFLLASVATTTRNSKDAQLLMERAAKRAGKIPRIIYTDKLKAYMEGITNSFKSYAKHQQGSPFEVGNNNNLIERFHGTIKERTKVMRALKNKDTLEKFMNGWLVHYNYFRPHTSLNDRTPSQAAGIMFPFRNWKDVVKQPYENTSRIPLKAYVPLPIKTTAIRKPQKRKKTVKRVTRKPNKLTTIQRVGK
jgi:transposase-like protein